MGIPDFFTLSPWKNPPTVERILALIWQLEDECEQQTWVDHNHPDCESCPCWFCEHAGGLWYFLRQSEAAFEGAIHTFPALCRRRAARSREAGGTRDLEYAAEMEARADELEREAEPIPTPELPESPPHVVLLNALKAQVDAESPPEPVYATV